MNLLHQHQNNHYVYHLIDPRNGIPFYVGKGKDDRMHDHEKMVMRGIIPNNNSFLFRKINKIKKMGMVVIYKKIAEHLSDEKALQTEVTEIKRLGRFNQGKGPLCNLTDGGEGNSGKIIREETKIKMSKVARLRLSDPNNHPMFRKHHSQHSKSKMSVKRKLWFENPSHREKTSIATKKGMAASDYVDRISKEITLISPDNKIVVAKNISKFCRDNGLQNGNLYKVLRGKIKSHKGWTLSKDNL